MSDFFEIVILLDVSGSMKNDWERAIAALDKFLVFLKEKFAGCRTSFSLFFFNDSLHLRFSGVQLSHGICVNANEFSPCNGTALYDSIASVVGQISLSQSRHGKPKQTICAIITDGDDTCSEKFSKSQLRDLVLQKQKNGWIFYFLGFGDADYLTASGIGFDRKNVIISRSVEGGFQNLERLIEAQKIDRSFDKIAIPNW